MQKLLLFGFMVALSVSAFAQGTFVPLNGDANVYMDRLDIKFSKILPVLHTGDKPYHRGKAAKAAETLLLSNLRFNKTLRFQLQYLVDDNGEWTDSLVSRTRKPLWKFYREPASFLHVSSKKKGLYDIRFNPAIDVNVGGESNGGRFIFQRVLGLEVRGNIKRVFSFYFNVLGSSARTPKYISEKFLPSTYNQFTYVPGQAYWKDYSSKLFKFNDGIDYFDARGYVNVNVLKYINISMGRDKFFIGNGQRSLFLSDAAAPYLFLRLNVNFWRVNYTSILAELTSHYVRGSDRLLPKKYMAVHHLSIQATHWLNLGLFEGVIMNRSNHFELQYLNPIMFYRSVEHAIGSPDNVLIGGDFKMNFVNHLSVYGQFLFDEFNFGHVFKRDGWWANKYAIQVGIKYIDIVPNLDAQLEVNVVRPFTYTHSNTTSDQEASYSHYNQPLAHPLGANFYEFLLNVRYQPIPRLSFNAKYIMARVGGDSLIAGDLTNYGSNILAGTGFGGSEVTRDLGNQIGQGTKGTINYFQLLTSYQAWHNIYFDLELLYRSRSTVKSVYNPQVSSSSFIFNVGVRMNLSYKRYEF
ncbi:MAG: hypothetical protein KA149_11375 [Chitinophagales bacterium]|nr:hypothetical protein [Chitinophagales bacterium]